MESQEKIKDNILKGVNKKLRIREIKIAIISIIFCILVGIVIYVLVFVKQTPINAETFKNVHIERRLESINEVSSEELQYNHLVFTINKDIFYSLSNAHYYIEDSENDNSVILYFYMTENYMQKSKSKLEQSMPVDIMLNPELLITNKYSIFKEITKVYYLVYDYNNFNQQDFDNAKNQAVLLWEK